MDECAYLKTRISEVSHYENGKMMIVVPQSTRFREQTMVPKGFVCVWQGRYCARHMNLCLPKVP
jgi:hypothetical protein